MSKKASSHPITVDLKPKTIGHKNYIRTIVENDITFCTGPAGSGKSYLAIGLACQYLVQGKVEKIVICRPTVEASPKGLGFLPGGVDDKISVYMLPAVEHMKLFLGKDLYHNYRRDEVIEFKALEYMRGSTLNNSFVIVEESQNCTTEQLKMILTRIGFDTKMVLNGDYDQTDLRRTGEDSDFNYVISRLEGIENIGHHCMGPSDIVRNKIIVDIINALQ